jgi:hypothetical protein
MKERMQIIQAITAVTVEMNEKRKLSCEDALRIAHEYQVAPEEIGRLCDEENIKVHACQLGCF